MTKTENPKDCEPSAACSLDAVEIGQFTTDAEIASNHAIENERAYGLGLVGRQCRRKPEGRLCKILEVNWEKGVKVRDAGAGWTGWVKRASFEQTWDVF